MGHKHIITRCTRAIEHEASANLITCAVLLPKEPHEIQNALCIVMIPNKYWENRKTLLYQRQLKFHTALGKCIYEFIESIEQRPFSFHYFFVFFPPLKCLLCWGKRKGGQSLLFYGSEMHLTMFLFDVCTLPLTGCFLGIQVLFLLGMNRFLSWREPKMPGSSSVVNFLGVFLNVEREMKEEWHFQDKGE